MATRKSAPLKWERLAPDWWSCSVGYARMEEGDLWSAYVNRNTRVGKGWTEKKPGFKTADRAKRWVEREAED